MVFGSLVHLICDIATFCSSAEIKELMFCWGIKLVLTFPYQPQANLVEKYNKNLKVALNAFQIYCNVSLCFNNVVSRATNYTPAELFYYWSEVLPSIDKRWSLHVLSWEAVDPQNIQKVWEVSQNFKEYHQKLEEKYNKTINEVSLKIGDMVLLESHFLSLKINDFSAKLAPQRAWAWAL
ncbi:hypothetical protein PR048_002240 [Dryococelus australis]|uniref:Integrase catalytic domain-containing protein n=1 Tax=Dryococelus australis TaxID=614101 RepID=A0ABQ9IJR6_9NEOP|nr:hypothetical protein PR048_002240 [Dryococelus australis]